MIKASAPGKLILFGEHAVFYGETAIATAVDKRAYATACELDEPKIVVESKNMESSLESSINDPTDNPIIKAVQLAIKKSKKELGVGIEINSNIPVGVGLGASAAVSTATAAATLYLLTNQLDQDLVCKIAYEAEKTTHSNPSGIDNNITTYGGTIAFRRGQFENLGAQNLTIVIGNTGISRKSSDLVKRVEAWVNDPRVAHSIFSIGSLSTQSKRALVNGNLTELGMLMDKNHKYLRALGVSSPELESLIKAAKHAGAFGAKLTGAGGGGCMIALTNSPEPVISALQSNGATAFQVKTNELGVKIEEES